MVALQLEYRFKGDTMWNDGHRSNSMEYRLPDNPDANIDDDSQPVYVTALELFALFDKFAMPELNHLLQDLPQEKRNDESSPQDEWISQVRDEVIFLRFRDDLKVKPSTGARGSGSATSRRHSSLDSSMHEDEHNIQTYQAVFSDGDDGNDEFEGTGSTAQENLTFPTLLEFEAVAKDVTEPETERREKLYEEESFQAWKFYLATNHSLLLYGVGSKRQLLTKFGKDCLKKDGDILMIDGFHKDLTVEALLDLIVDCWLDGNEPPSYRNKVTNPIVCSDNSAVDNVIVSRAIAIGTEVAKLTYKENRRPLYLIIHNIDGVGLRNQAAQQALAGLVLNSTLPNGMRSISLVASVDHVNSPTLLWDSLTRTSYSWIAKEVNTYRPYGPEIVESNIPEGRQKKTKRVRSEHRTETPIISVLNSLAPRHAESLQELATLQLRQVNNKTTDDEAWINYVDLLRQCQSHFVVSADQQLRNYLKELIDQGIVEKQASAASPKYRIPDSVEKLQEIIDYKRTS